MADLAVHRDRARAGGDNGDRPQPLRRDARRAAPVARHGGLSFGWESCRVLFAEPNLPDLLREHHEELGVHKAEMPLDPDWQRFVQLEDAGLVKSYQPGDLRMDLGRAHIPAGKYSFISNKFSEESSVELFDLLL